MTTPAATLIAPASLKAVLAPASNAQINLTWTEAKNTVPLAGFLCFLAARPLLLELRLLLHRLRKQSAPDDPGSSADP